MAPYTGFKGSPAQRFEAFFIPEPNSGCWLWIGAQCNPRYGYGVFSMGAGVKETAHRAAWLIFCGPIPDGAEIDHRCRNPYCVNPDHLRPLAVAENRALRTKERSVCWRGHRLTGENLSVEPSGIRRCKQCRAVSRLRYENGKRERLDA